MARLVSIAALLAVTLALLVWFSWPTPPAVPVSMRLPHCIPDQVFLRCKPPWAAHH